METVELPSDPGMRVVDGMVERWPMPENKGGLLSRTHVAKHFEGAMG